MARVARPRSTCRTRACPSSRVGRGGTRRRAGCRRARTAGRAARTGSRGRRTGRARRDPALAADAARRAAAAMRAIWRASSAIAQSFPSPATKRREWSRHVFVRASIAQRRSGLATGLTTSRGDFTGAAPRGSDLSSRRATARVMAACSSAQRSTSSSRRVAASAASRKGKPPPPTTSAFEPLSTYRAGRPHASASSSEFEHASLRLAKTKT